MYNDDYKGDIPVKSKVRKENKNKVNFKFNLDTKVIIGVCLIIIIIIIFLVYDKSVIYQDSYGNLEDTLVEKAKEYVNNNNISNDNEFFIEASKLSVQLKNNCYSMSSGVFVNKDTYKAYLWCEDYKTNIIDNENDYIELNGGNVIFLSQGMDYLETSYINKNNTTGIKVISNGNVGTEQGVYNIEYNVIRYGYIIAKLERKVVIVNNPTIKSLYPTIKLNGDEIIYLNLMGNYIDSGVTATDSIDGLYSADEVKINNNVEISSPGEYQIVYTIINSRGYASSVTRKVIVATQSDDITTGSIISPSSLTNKNVTISISSFGESYDYTLLPDGKTTNERTFKYNVSENGTYEFKVYDKNNNYNIKQVVVNNINRIKPSGSCQAKVYEDYTDISVNASSINGISSFLYSINGGSGNFIASSTYRISTTTVNSVSVIAKDIIGNEQTFACTIEKVEIVNPQPQPQPTDDDMEIVPIPSVSFKCKTDVTLYNKQLEEKVNKAGIKTRKGVVAAANYLATELGFKIEYWWAGKYNEKGLNREWGCDKAIWANDGKGKYEYGNVLPYGMDCSGFVKWAFINGGFDANTVPKSKMESANYGKVKPNTVYFKDNSNLVNNIKPGDLLYTTGHIALVVAVDSTRIKIAQLTPKGLGVDLIDKKTGKAITQTSDFLAYVLLDDYYKEYGN